MSKSKSPSVSIIIPAKNEAGTIEDAIHRIPPMGSHTQLVFVEDHSTDSTGQVIHRLIRKYRNTKDITFFTQKNEFGKGHAVYNGIKLASGDIIIILDADLTVRPEDLPKFYDALAGGTCGFAMGSRFMYPMEKNSMKFLNTVGNLFYSRIFTILLKQPVTDTLCGTKAFWRASYHDMIKNRFLDLSDPFGEFSLIFAAARLRLKFREIPVHYYARVYGKSNTKRLAHGLQLLFLVFRNAKVVLDISSPTANSLYK